MPFHPIKTVSALKERIFRNDFAKSVLTLSSGIALAQGIALLTTPVISRVYNASAIGDYALIVSNGAILGSVVCLSLMLAIMLPKEDEESRAICTTMFGAVVISMTVILAVLLLLADHWQLFRVTANYRACCILLYFYVILNSLSSLYYAYTSRQKLYKVMFWNPMLGTVSNAVIDITLGLLGWGTIGYSLGKLTSLLLNIFHMHHHVRPLDFFHTHPISILKKYKSFPLVQLPANLIGSTAQQLPTQMISALFGSTILGNYSMSLTILRLPTMLLAGPVNQVFYKEATKRFQDGENIGTFSFKLLKANVKIALLPIITLIIFGEPLFAFVLGDQWRTAGTFAAILGISELFEFCSQCLSGRYVLIGKQKFNLYLSCGQVAATFASLSIGNMLFHSITGTLIVYSVIKILYTSVDISLFLRLNQISLWVYVRFALLYILIPAGCAILIRFGLTHLSMYLFP